MLTTMASARSMAALTRERWPSWRYPMVGTRPTRRPAARCARDHARMASASVMTSRGAVYLGAGAGAACVGACFGLACAGGASPSSFCCDAGAPGSGAGSGAASTAAGSSAGSAAGVSGAGASATGASAVGSSVASAIAGARVNSDSDSDQPR